MDTSDRQRWLRMMLLVGVVYFFIGIAFGEFAGRAASSQARSTWNLFSFLTALVVFAVHIGYEHFRLRKAPRIAAWHVCLAVALGALALAVSANIHGLRSGMRVGSNQQLLLGIALVVWPLMTAIPAFVVALVASAVLSRSRRSN